MDFFRSSRYLYNKVDELLYILIGMFGFALYLLYLIERPTKPPKKKKKPNKRVVWFKDGKEI